MTDLLIENGWVLPMGDTYRQLAPGWVAIEGETIAALGEGDTPDGLRASSAEIVDARDCAVLPGFVNGHTHFEQTFMRGAAEDQPLAIWLSNAIQPFQAAMTPDDIHLASLLALVENLKSGVTTVTQHHKITGTRDQVEAALHAAEAIGIRVLFARGWRDSGGRGEPPEHIEREIRALAARWHGSANGRIRIGSGPMEPSRCSAAAMNRMLKAARELGLPTHIHVSETADEVAEFKAVTGVTQIEWLKSFGGLAPDVQLVHCVHLADADIALIADQGAVVVHCPASNMRLASGIAPLSKMLKQHIPVCLGTDGPASNDTQDILETAKLALFSSKIASHGSSPPSIPKLLEALTRIGAQVAGFAGTGTLVPGATADVIVVSLCDPRAMPVHKPDTALVLCSSAARVEAATVGGRLLLRSGHVTGLDENALIRKCQLAGENLLNRAIRPGSARLARVQTTTA